MKITLHFEAGKRSPRGGFSRSLRLWKVPLFFNLFDVIQNRILCLIHGDRRIDKIQTFL